MARPVLPLPRNGELGELAAGRRTRHTVGQGCLGQFRIDCPDLAIGQEVKLPLATAIEEAPAGQVQAPDLMAMASLIDPVKRQAGVAAPQGAPQRIPAAP